MDCYRMWSSDQVTRQRNGKPAYPVGDDQYFVAFFTEEGKTQCLTTRDHEEAARWVDLGRHVSWTDRRCGFCGGPTPCLRD